MKENLEVIAERIADMREIMNISAEEMAMATGMSVEEYLEKYEKKEKKLHTLAKKLMKMMDPAAKEEWV